MRSEILELNESGSCRLYCKLIEQPLTADPRPNPAILWIPGGGFSACAPEDGEAVILSLAGHGYAGFTMTYPVGEEYRFPDILVYVSRAILTIRSHAPEWNIDPEKIVIAGGSAGGFISAAYAALWNHPELEKLTGCGNGNNRPNALLTQNGLFNSYQQTENGILEVSVYDYVGAEMPPAFILHAADDPIVDVDQALGLAWAMRRAGRPFGLFISDSGHHVCLQKSRRCLMESGRLSAKIDDWLPAALLFLDNVFGTEHGYERFSMPGLDEAPGEGSTGSKPEMRLGDYESGMMWGAVPERSKPLNWQRPDPGRGRETE